MRVVDFRPTAENFSKYFFDKILMYLEERGEKMPIIKSSKKSVKTDKKQTVANNFYTATVKNAIKSVEKAVANKDKDAAVKALDRTLKAIDKASSKGLIKKNTAARQKSRLNKKVKEMTK